MNYEILKNGHGRSFWVTTETAPESEYIVECENCKPQPGDYLLILVDGDEAEGAIYTIYDVVDNEGGENTVGVNTETWLGDIQTKVQLYQHNILLSFEQHVGDPSFDEAKGFVFQIIDNDGEPWSHNTFYDNLNNLCREKGKSIVITVVCETDGSSSRTGGLLQYDLTTRDFVLDICDKNIRLSTLEIGVNKVSDSVIQIL